MQINNQIKSISENEVSELRKKLRRGDAELIAEMLDGLYLPITISHMIRGHRKMKPIVYKAGIKLVEIIDNLKNELK